MSYVTTVVLFGRHIPDEARQALEEGYEHEHYGLRRVSFGELSDYTPNESCDTWNHWHGTKGPESDVFGGAFNYLDEEHMLAWLRGLKWYGRVAVLIGSEEEPENFHMEIVGEGSDPYVEVTP